MTPLTHEEALTPLWYKLRAELGEYLAAEREANDYASDDISTATRRGKIELLKELLDLQQTVDLLGRHDGDVEDEHT